MWYMHRTENPANEVQLLESPLKNIGMTITEYEDEIIYKLKLDNGQLVQMNVCANCHRELHKNVGLE